MTTQPAAKSASKAVTIDQKRAQSAWAAIRDLRKIPPKDQDTFVRHARRLPIRIRSAGLGHAVAFVHAKEKKANAGLKLLRETLGKWVLKRVPPSISDNDGDPLIAAIRGGDAIFLRRATDEALAWLQWLNRFAEAEKPEVFHGTDDAEIGHE
jgi:CRISPR-associated protein Cmr5